MAGSLSGLLVVAIEQAVSAPVCTVRLADAGARVIKIERAEGDTARHYDKTVKGVSACFAWHSRGKESIVLDLKSEAELALANRMVARADVFVQNLAPGAAARLGLGAQDVIARHPRLIAVDILGYGQDTACRDMRAYDLLVQAESGICGVTGSPDSPAKTGVSIADIGTGMNAYGVILEALLARQRSGRGQAIEVAMFDTMADWMAVPLLHLEQAGQSTGRHDLSHAAIHPYAPYRCRDGEIVIAIQHPAEWRRFCAGVLRRPDLIADPRFADNPARVANRTALDREIAPMFAGWNRAEAIEHLDAHQIVWGRVSSVEEPSRHPALRRITVSLPSGESFTLPRPAARGELIGGGVPALGAHGERIRAEFAP